MPIETGLEAMSRHAKGLGYDAVVLFLDELVLWLASRMSDVAFVSREGAKVVKLVEGDAAKRPAPIVSLIARQRDLRELVGDHVPGAQSLSAVDILRHSEGRFDTITLEDRNLPAIVEQRLLKPRSEAARQQLDDAFAKVRRELEERGERDALLTDTGDLSAFRRLYPFSPALVDALVALSGAMQRERTALKVMLQLLVDNRDRLEVGQLVPLGDLFDAVNSGDEPLTEVMRAQFAQARRLWSQRFEPVLLRNYQLSPDDVRNLPPNHPFTTDARLVKSLLIAALVPEVAPLRSLTVSRLTALNSGIVRAFIPGTERQQVLDKLRTWMSEIGELRLGDDEHDPTVSVVLQGIDTAPILEAARVVDNDGERKRRVKELLGELLHVKGADTTMPSIEVLWRGTVRTVDVVFANVRNPAELPDESLRAGANPKLVIDFPWDQESFGPNDDRARVEDYRRERAPEWTGVWLPNFFSGASEQLLGRLVRLEYVLNGDTFERLAGHLSPTERPLARIQLANEQAGVRERVIAILRQAYGVDPVQPGAVDQQLNLGEQFAALDPSLSLRPPVGTSLRGFTEGLSDQLFAHRFPKHPDFTERISSADLRNTYSQVSLALGQPGGRLENVDAPMRRVLTRIASPLQLGTMYQAHFIVELQHWLDLIDRKRTEAGTATLTVAAMRAWLDGADTPADRRGLTIEVADLVILAIAAATDRTFIESERTVTRPEIGRLRNEWELRSQDLPDEVAWTTALRRANEVGIVPASTLRTATAVADLNERIYQELASGRTEAVRALPTALGRLTGVVAVPADAARVTTASAAQTLVDELTRRPDHAVDVLAGLDVPSNMAAIGTSIKQSTAVAQELDRCNTELIRQAIGLGGAFTSEAAQISNRLTEAAVADELTLGLVGRLRDAEQASTSLLARAATATAPPATSTTSSDVSSIPAESSGVVQVVNPAGDPVIVRTNAEHELAVIRERLRREANLELTWQIGAVEDADS